jgi:hypothetical protein
MEVVISTRRRGGAEAGAEFFEGVCDLRIIWVSDDWRNGRPAAFRAIHWAMNGTMGKLEEAEK